MGLPKCRLCKRKPDAWTMLEKHEVASCSNGLCPMSIVLTQDQWRALMDSPVVTDEMVARAGMYLRVRSGGLFTESTARAVLEAALKE